MTVRISTRDEIGLLQLDRPDVRNAIDLDLLAELGAGLDKLAADGVRAAVLGGTGAAFCAGADLALVRSAFEGDPPAVLAPLVDSLHDVIRRLRVLPFPVVAAVEGPAVGAGMGLALATDLRVVARSAVLIPGYFGIGSSPDGGVSYFLTRALGAARATSLVLRNLPLRADDLLAAGLADEVVDDGQAEEAALRVAGTVATAPPLALVRLRRLVDQATTHVLVAHLDAERTAVAELWPTADFHDGVAAFLERRRPNFTGR